MYYVLYQFQAKKVSDLSSWKLWSKHYDLSNAKEVGRNIKTQLNFPARIRIVQVICDV